MTVSKGRIARWLVFLLIGVFSGVLIADPKPDFWVLGFGEGRDVPALIQ